MIYLQPKCRTIFISFASFILGCIFTVGFVSIDSQSGEFDSSLQLKNENAKLFESIRYFLIIVIISSADNLLRRKAIRETWSLLSKDDNSVKCYFVVGSDGLSNEKVLELKNEQIKYNDIFLLSVLDDYASLTHKVLNAIVWFDKEFNFDYLLKCDDDSFVNTLQIIHELKNSFSNTNRLYWGFFDGRAHVKRAGKWKEKEWILCDRYLPYALGGGYVLSQSLVHYISENANVLSLYGSEDVSVGVWLSPLNITRQHDSRFDTEFLSRGCLNEYLITHKKSPKDMYRLYSSIVKTGKLCEIETKVRNSYEYNWDNPPSLCCKRNDNGSL